MAKSFFERLTGSVSADNTEEDENPSPIREINEMSEAEPEARLAAKTAKQDWLQSNEEGQLTIDMHQTPSEIIIQTAVAGVKPDDLDVSITNDMVTIRGKRQKIHEAAKEDALYQELYWGVFSRSILLPQEIDSEAAEASLKHGLLTIRLPKLDKNRIQKVKVKME